MSAYNKPDFWALKAQKEGYPARSVYKLKELREKFALLPAGERLPLRILDMGAAPGSWSLYMLRTLQKRVALTACDVTPLDMNGIFAAFREQFYALQGDFTTAEVREQIMERGPYHLIMSDAAPATSGNRTIDTARSLELAQTVAAYTREALLPGGSCVIKLFQGGETAALARKLKPFFAKTQCYKPASCRASSFETYLVALGKKRLPAAKNAGDEI